MFSEAPTEWFLSDDVSPAVAAANTLWACLGIVCFIGMLYIMFVYVLVVLKSFGEAMEMLYEFLKKLMCEKKKDNKNEDVENAVETIYMKPPNPASEPTIDINKPELNNNSEDKLV